MKGIDCGPLDITKIVRSIPQTHREAMLDVILAWASFDGAVSQLYASIFDLEAEVHADAISDMPAHLKLRKIQLEVRKTTPALAARIKKLKLSYEGQSKLRDTIAHCKCVGHYADDAGRAVFLRYRTANEGGLLVEAIHVDAFRRATRFAKAVEEWMLEFANDLRASRA